MDCLFKVFFTKKCSNEFKKLDNGIKQKLWQKIIELESFSSDSRNIKRLITNGKSDCFRLRVGDYRILFEVEWVKKKIWILDVGHRREIYR